MVEGEHEGSVWVPRERSINRSHGPAASSCRSSASARPCWRSSASSVCLADGVPVPIAAPAKQNFGDKCVTKLELGNGGNQELFDRALFPHGLQVLVIDGDFDLVLPRSWPLPGLQITRASMLNVFSTLNVFPYLTKSGVKLVAGKSEVQVVPDRGAAFSPRYRQNHPHGCGFAEKRSGGRSAAGHAAGDRKSVV